MDGPAVLTLQSPTHDEPTIGSAYHAMMTRLLGAEALIANRRFSAAVRDLAAVRADYRALKPILAAYTTTDEIGDRLRSLSRAAERAARPTARCHEELSSLNRPRDGWQRTPVRP